MPQNLQRTNFYSFFSSVLSRIIEALDNQKEREKLTITEQSVKGRRATLGFLCEYYR